MIKSAAETSFLVLIFTLGFMQPSWLFHGLALVPTDVAFLTTAALALLAISSGQIAVPYHRFYVVLGFYAVGLGLSAAFSDDQGLSVLKLVGEYYLIALAVLTFLVATSQDMLRRIVRAWLAATAVGSAVSTLAVVFFYLGITNFITAIAFHHYGSLPPGNYVRIQGTFIYPAMLCNYLTVSILMLLAARRLAWVGRSSFVVLLIIYSITAIFTFTPGLGSLMLGVAIWSWLDLRTQDRPASAGVLLVAGIIAAIAFQLVSAFTVIPTETSPYFAEIWGLRIDPTQRLLAWTEALRVFAAHPFFGKGAGLPTVAVTFLPPDGRMQLITDAHNTFLNIAAQAGLAAFLPLILLCVSLTRRVLPFSLEPADVLRTALGIAFVCGFVLQGLVGSFEDGRHLWVLMGLILACPAADAKQALPSRRR